MTNHKGLTREPWTNYKTSNYCIAYLDILGAKQMICNDIAFKFLNYLNMLMEDAISETNWRNYTKNNEFYIKIFSDNILIATEIKDSEKKRTIIETIFNLVANIYNEALRYKYLMRGSIIEGEFFHNEIIVYGKGLIEAVQLEEKEAIYPRILVQKNLSRLLPHYIIQCEDGWDILNVFQLSDDFDYLYFKDNLLKMLKKFKNDIHIIQKIMWMVNYYNSYITTRTLVQHNITYEELKIALN